MSSVSKFVFIRRSCLELLISTVKDEEEFNGVVKTIVNSKKNLCFIVREEDFLRLKKFEEFQSKEPLRKLGHLPKAHMVSMYHFKERNKFYRAYTLKSNVCDANTRLFFMDTGEVVYGLLKVSNFYMLPDDLFDFQSLAYFCRIQNLVDIMKAKDIVMTFKVKKNSSFFKRPLYDLSRERCLVLDVVNPPTFEVEPTLNNSVISVYSSFESSKVSIEDLTKSQKIIEKGTMIVVYRDVIYDEKSMYAHILTLEDLKDFQMLNENNIDEGYNLRMWLANDSIKMNLPKLDESPKINDVVIFQDSMLRASRALVKRISPDKTKFEVSVKVQ